MWFYFLVMYKLLVMLLKLDLTVLAKEKKINAKGIRKKTKLHDERGSLGNDNSLKLELNSVQGRLGKVGGGSSLQIASRKSLFDGTDDSNDCSCNDSEDESCLDSCMDKIVASFKR